MAKQRRLVGLIGANIMKSLSPAMHEDAFAAAGIHGHYHLMDLDQLPGRRLEQLLAAAKATGFAGLNVTYPVKQAIMALLDEVSADARQIGAVNTVTFTPSGATSGYNTDRSGFRRSFEEALGRDCVAGKKVLLIGAGGAGRAVAFALMDLGAATVIVRDTDQQKATMLVADLMTHFGSVAGELAHDTVDALDDAAGIVNATPIGMLGIPGNPLAEGTLRARHFVADIIYTPIETELVKVGRHAGCRVLTGGGMCVHQAADAFRLFSGIEPDVGRMHRVFSRALAERDAALASVA